MDFYRNVSFSGDYHQNDQVLASSSPCSMLTPLDDLLSSQNTEVDVGMEWLSIFVEDCLSSTGNCLPQAPISTPTSTNPTTNPSKPKTHQNPPNYLNKFPIPGKARSKRKRITSYKTRNPLSSWSYSSKNTLNNFPISEPPLLHNQAYWLADSELIFPKKEMKQEIGQEQEEREVSKVESGSNLGGRRCSHCLSQKTPQWRAGPMGPKTLCNACGVRYKSGRLLPEYRPAKSPTFVSFLHSNSHKKVLELRNSSA